MLKYLLLAVLPASIITHTQAQNLTTVKTNIEDYSAAYPEEKMYMQFDKPVYAAGDTIWFKAYLIKGNDVSALSKTLYVDFADTAGNVLQHGVFLIQQASAAGNFTLPSAYSGGLIHIHAYTRWMLNFDTAFLYNRDVRIINASPLNKPSVAAKTVLKPVVQFFPEGGDCIAGIHTKIAFKANYQNGLPANIKGTVVNSKGAVVDTLVCIHDGMGLFYMDAEAGETYTAQYTDERGSIYQATLPDIKAASATIEIEQAGGKLGYTVKRSENVPANGMQLHVVALMHQNLVYIANIDLDRAINTGGIIPVAQLPSGILQVTLFDRDWKPLAERISFVNNNNYRFETAIGFDTLAIKKREKNVLVITVPDFITANLSVAVTDPDIGTNSRADIISHLLVTSIAAHLDLVMLTNGWRRYKWDEVVRGVKPVLKYPKEAGWLSLYGKVDGVTPKQIAKAGPLMAIVTGTDTSKTILYIPLEKDGSFAQPSYTFFDTIRIYYHFAANSGFGFTHPPEASFSNGALISPLHLSVTKNGSNYVYVDTAGDYRRKMLAAEQARLMELLKTVTLKEVTVTARARPNVDVLDDKYARGVFSGGDAVQLDVANDPLGGRTIDPADYIQRRMPGMRVDRSDPAQPAISWKWGHPALFVDGAPAPADILTTMNMQNVAYIKIIRPPFLGVIGGGASGAIAIYTRQGNDDLKLNPQAALPYKVAVGYTYSKDFYSPDYDAKGTFANKDVRSTLYWNPYILTSPQNHVIKLKFYNNDVTTSFRVIIEGVSSDGKLTRVEKVVE